MSKSFKCPYCHKSYLEKAALYSHIDSKHSEYVSPDFPPARLYFNFVNKKEVGHCVICGNETTWNPSVERYNRFCSEKCKEAYVKDFQKKMIKVYGKTTKQMLSDPEVQKKMLSNRKISGKYKWSDGSAEIEYTGTYELDFLKFLDLFLGFEATDIISPAPQVFNYNYNGNKAFYIPDFYIPSINTIVEIKDTYTGKATGERDTYRNTEKEKLKDKIMEEQKEYNFIKLTGKDNSQFLNFLMKLKNNTGDVEEKKEHYTPIIDINEATELIYQRLKAQEAILDECSKDNFNEGKILYKVDEFMKGLASPLNLTVNYVSHRKLIKLILTNSKLTDQQKIQELQKLKTKLKKANTWRINHGNIVPVLDKKIKDLTYNSSLPLIDKEIEKLKNKGSLSEDVDLSTEDLSEEVFLPLCETTTEKGITISYAALTEHEGPYVDRHVLHLRTKEPTLDGKPININDRTICPLDLSVIPNYMGINLCSVYSVEWSKLKDGQLVDLTIHFEPEIDIDEPYLT